MAAVPATAEAPLTVRKRDDDTSRPGRTWGTDSEVLELVEEAHQRLRPGTRFYSNLANHLVLAYHELRKWEAQTPAERDGRRVVSLLHITSNLYDVDRRDFAAARHKSDSLRRSWLPILREAGLIEYETQFDDVGRPVGIRYELTGATLAALGRDSSVGGAIPDTFPAAWAKRAETRAERQAARTKPWCRRAGQTDAAGVAGPSVKRLVRRPGGTAAGCPSSSSLGDFPTPGSRPPRTTSWGSRQTGVSVRGCAARPGEAGCAGLSDTNQRPWWLDRVAALEAELADGASREAGLAALAVLVAEGAPIEAALCAAWRAIWRRPARMSRRALLELRNARRVIERCSSLPGPDGADRATAWLLADVAEYHDDHAAGRSLAKVAPASVGFFVRRLRREARSERRAWRARRSYAAEGSS